MGIPTGNKQLDLAGLDTLGSDDRGDDVHLGKTAQKLVDLAHFLISEAQNNLNKAGAEATGELDSSMKVEDIEINGSQMSLNVTLLDRYKFIDLGVKGVESGSGKFSFKNKYPNKKMATALLKWIRVRGKRGIKYAPISRTERKDKSLKKKIDKSNDLKGLAYAMATNIKKKGIKPTKFFTNAVKATEKVIKKELAGAYKIDIIENLNDL